MSAGLSPQPQTLHTPRQPLDLCRCHKDLLSSACAHISSCIFVCFTCFTCHSSKGILNGSKDLLRRDPPLYSGYFQIPNLNWECLEFGTSCGCFVEFSLDVPGQDHFALFHIFFFFNSWNILICICLIYCMLLFVSVNHCCCVIEKSANQ